MHSPLEIAKNFVEIGIHKVRMSALKMLALGIFAGIYIAFAGNDILCNDSERIGSTARKRLCVPCRNGDGSDCRK